MALHFINLNRNSYLWLVSTVSVPAVLGALLFLHSAPERHPLHLQAAWPPASQHPPVRTMSCLFMGHPLRAVGILRALHTVGHPSPQHPCDRNAIILFILQMRKPRASWSVFAWEIKHNNLQDEGDALSVGTSVEGFAQGHGSFWQSQRALRFPSFPSASQGQQKRKKPSQGTTEVGRPSWGQGGGWGVQNRDAETWAPVW